jgi:hypothetical protein
VAPHEEDSFCHLGPRMERSACFAGKNDPRWFFIS